MKARKSEAERPAGCAFLLRVPFGKHFQKTGAGKQTGGTRLRWEIRRSHFCAAFPTKDRIRSARSAGKGAVSSISLAVEYRPSIRLRANGGIGRRSGRLFSAIKRSQKPQGGKRGERRKSFSRGGKASNDSLGQAFRGGYFRAKNSLFLIWEL